MRALILSDVHANLEALTAVLAAAAGAYDQLWNLGDLVGYGGSPNQVIDLLRPLETLVVRGNHDRVCSGSGTLMHFNPVARAAALWTRGELTAENRVWLLDLPKGPVTPIAVQPDDAPPLDIPARCVHGSPLDEDQYILSMRDAWASLNQMEAPITFFGHTHIQGGFTQRAHEWQELRPQIPVPAPANLSARRAAKKRALEAALDTAEIEQASSQSWTLALDAGTRHLINPGSVGQPRDGDWRAAFAIFDSEAATVDFHRVPYDLVSSQGRILLAGLPERLAERLREGR